MTGKNALVVYESEFGNTHQIAVAVAEGVAEALGAEGSVEVAAADHVDPAWLGPVRLLVVGAPTHAFTLPRQQSREDAVRQGATEAPESGVREWLNGLGRASGDIVAATFDTRMKAVRHLPGSAANAAVRRLKRHGFHTTAHESFYVDSTSGPLLDGEEDRARAWGRRIATDAKALQGAAAAR